MDGPTHAGTADGETTNFNARIWTWSDAKKVWLPDSPQPFDTVKRADGQEWFYHPVSHQWINSQNFPDDRGLIRPGTVDGTVRDTNGQTDE